MTTTFGAWTCAFSATAFLVAGCSGGGGGGQEPPDVKEPIRAVALEPGQGATAVPVTATVRATFDSELDGSAGPQSFRVEHAGGRVTGTVSVSQTGGQAVVVFEPQPALEPGTEYTAVIARGLRGTTGRTLEQDVQWSFTTLAKVVQPPVPPVVVSTVPDSNQTGLRLDVVVSVTFDKDLDPVSVDDDTFTLRSPQAAVRGRVSYDGPTRTARLEPDSALEPGVAHTVTLSSRIRAKDGGKLAEQRFGFTTAERPHVVSTSPQNGTKGVQPTAVISVQFDRDMDPDSFDGGMTVATAQGAVPGGVRYSAGTRSADFMPTSGLEPGAEHRVSLSPNVRSGQGVPIEAFEWRFTVADRPKVQSASPQHKATGVRRDAVIQIVFDRAMDPGTINASTVRVRAGQDPVAGKVSYLPQTHTAVFAPDAPLSTLTSYWTDVLRGIRDANGIQLPFDYHFEFKTEDGAFQVTRRVAQVFDTEDALPAIALSENGEATAVWRESTFAGYRPYGDRFIPGAAWQGRQLLDPEIKGSSGAPLVAADRDGNALAVWQWQDGDSIWLRANHYEQGTGWKGVLDLARDANLHIHHKDVQVAMAPDGRAVVAWLYEDWFEQKYNIRYRRYHPASGWSAFGQVFQIDQTEPISSIRIATDDNGDAVALFVQPDGNGRLRIHASSSRWNQLWSAPMPIDDKDLVARDGRDPMIAVRGGLAIAVWVQDSQHQSVWRDRLWANRFDFAASNWDGPALCDDVDQSDADDAAVALNGGGTAVVVWRQKRGTLPQLPMFGYHRIDARLPLGQGLGSPKLLTVDLRGYGDARPEDFRLSIDDRGNALAIHRQESKKDHHDVLSRRYDASADSWAAATVIENNNLPAKSPSLASLPDGRAFVVWFGYEAAYGEVLANHFE